MKFDIRRLVSDLGGASRVAQKNSWTPRRRATGRDNAHLHMQAHKERAPHVSKDARGEVVKALRGG